jgi:potassium channel
MHGTSALLEAVKNANDNVMEVLLANDAKLCMSEHNAASVLCQTVSDGDIVLLKRLLRAGINPNAADYDKRTAAHIAAAEGNTVALRTLAENGADLALKDRWEQTAWDEAQRSQCSIQEDLHRTLTSSEHSGVSGITF